MAEGDQTPQQTATTDEENETEKQASPYIIEIHDSCEEEGRPDLSQMEEKTFVSGLHSFMKDRGSPIERIPHLGFKQLNLWKIYNAVEKLGGYDSVTTQRLWKRVYDQLGGSPGSTSAATCTRRHYEKLVLPFERNMKGEEDKPLPPNKPRKPYRRNSDGKVHKADRKRKMVESDRDMDSEVLKRRSPEAACQSQAVITPRPALWAATSDSQHSDCSQPNPLCSSVYARLVQGPSSVRIPFATGEIISPLEKKKRLAQASLNSPPITPNEDKERPSVIQCSQSPSRASPSRYCKSSDGSPLPLSPSSSRSPSPYSVSSEDGATGNKDKPLAPSGLPSKCSSSEGNHEDRKSVGSSQTSKEGQTKDVSQITSQTSDSFEAQVKESLCRLVNKGGGQHFAHPFTSSSSCNLTYGWSPTSTSSFTKVIPKSLQPLRPAPLTPVYNTKPSSLMHPDSLNCVKKLNNTTPWFYLGERRDKYRTTLPKIPATEQSMPHSTAGLPPTCVLSSYDKSGRDSRHMARLHPTLFPQRMRLPQSQLMYRHVPEIPALIGPAVYTYPYSIPLFHPQTGYTLPAMNPIYPYKL